MGHTVSVPETRGQVRFAFGGQGSKAPGSDRPTAGGASQQVQQFRESDKDTMSIITAAFEQQPGYGVSSWRPVMNQGAHSPA